jgi:cytoskeletal protein RodZ
MKAKQKNKSRSNNKASNKQQKKKIIVASLAVGAAGILGYFGWQYLKKKKEAKGGAELDESLKPVNNSVNYEVPVTIPKATTKPSYTSTTITPKSDFPLKKGSKGENVRLLQEILIAKYGKQYV